MLHYESREARYDPRAFPLGLRAACFIASAVVVASILIGAGVSAAASILV